MSFKPFKTAFLSFTQLCIRALMPLSDKQEFQLASISLRSGMFLAKLLSASSVKLSIPAIFRQEILWQFFPSAVMVGLEAAHCRRPSR